MEEARKPTSDFERWIAFEVLPKTVAIASHMGDSPDWAKNAAAQAAIKPFFYWAQDRASSTSQPSASRTPQAVNPAGPSSLSNLVTKHPELVLHSGPPGVTMLIPKTRLDPELWEEVHNTAKAAGYQYVKYEPSTGSPGHWRKVTA